MSFRIAPSSGYLPWRPPNPGRPAFGWGWCLFVVGALGLWPCAVAGAETSRDALEFRLQWGLSTSVGDYLRHGQRDPRWDGVVTNFLAKWSNNRRWNTTGSRPARSELDAAATAVHASGCTDPFVRYVLLQHANFRVSDDLTAVSKWYRETADQMEETGYSACRKYYAVLRASQVLRNATDDDTLPDVVELRVRAAQHLKAFVEDPGVPVEEVDDAVRSLMGSLNRDDALLVRLMEPMEGVIFDRRPEQITLLKLRGDYEIRRAWIARSNRPAIHVSAAGWEGFDKHLKLARRALTRAWELDPADPGPPTRMLTVCLGMSSKRAEMELWFERAMTADPNNRAACQAKLYYLEPKWHGSAEELVKFGRECVASTKWGGEVPLTLVDAHEALVAMIRDEEARGKYWERPEVWKDVQASFERLIELNPTLPGWRNNYVSAAYRSKAWATVQEQVSRLDEIDFDYFGGREAFERMMTEIRKHLAARPSP
jgi:hypothetical protein